MCVCMRSAVMGLHGKCQPRQIVWGSEWMCCIVKNLLKKCFFLFWSLYQNFKAEHLFQYRMCLLIVGEKGQDRLSELK